MIYKINNLKGLDNLTKAISEKLKGNEIILLKGDLGVGKTTFTKYLLKNLGVMEDVTSPTFTIMNHYETPKFDIYHIDMYRIKDFDISDLLGKGLIIIEWPKNLDKNLENVIDINIDFDEDDSRIFKIKGLDIDF